MQPCASGTGDFNPRAPCGARPCKFWVIFEHLKFQSTRPVWGATNYIMFFLRKQQISIHAPRVGRDPLTMAIVIVCGGFQSTRPVWGATCLSQGLCLSPWRFQSTRPVWGATLYTTFNFIASKYFNPRAPCGARLILIFCAVDIALISIHAPRVGRDSITFRENARLLHFNPRAPCGARRTLTQYGKSVIRFQSTRPVWGATSLTIAIRSSALFQSTRPVWGATARWRQKMIKDSDFNPRAPCGARPWYLRRTENESK